VLDRAEKRIVATGSPAELQKSQDRRVHAFFSRTVEPSGKS